MEIEVLVKYPIMLLAWSKSVPLGSDFVAKLSKHANRTLPT
eukprot:CAMPEP_0172464326 /NCGR_PEP_ID=MMETSP1065-20121228/50113_1 /TAXON_ID=265537 /ORGANISM="Amphiprora paludosa, Strain CCMP125" /LENGTH=40 /DNA_ID= /DNA_START= /DNA_END= /DNA_ORIENTATION=